MALANFTTSITGGLLVNTDGVAEEITYISRETGKSVVCKGVVDRSDRTLMEFEDMTAYKIEAVLFLRNDAVEGVTAVAEKDTVTVDSVDYRVRAHTSPDIDNVWKIAIVRVDVDRRGANILER